MKVMAATDDPRVLLLAMAFGQGAGTLLASTDALEAALSYFQQRVQNLPPGKWEENILKIVEFTRALGTLSAVHAAQSGAIVIGAEDVSFAIAGTQNNRAAPLGICNC
jgi:hypothetical protein